MYAYVCTDVLRTYIRSTRYSAGAFWASERARRELVGRLTPAVVIVVRQAIPCGGIASPTVKARPHTHYSGCEITVLRTEQLNCIGSRGTYRFSETLCHVLVPFKVAKFDPLALKPALLSPQA